MRPRGGAGWLDAGTVLEEEDVVQELPWVRAVAGDSDSVAELRLAASPPSTTAMEEVEELGGQPEKRDREDECESEAELCESAHAVRGMPRDDEMKPNDTETSME